jgi:hypothetical protein
LSERQVVAVSKFASRRETLTSENAGPSKEEKWCKRVDRKERFLKETGCWYWDG